METTFLTNGLTHGSNKFTQAIEIEPENHVLYSNRSGAYASKKDFEMALEDANKTTTIKPDWAKGWGRKGAALHGTGDLGIESQTNPFENSHTKHDSSRCKRRL